MSELKDKDVSLNIRSYSEQLEEKNLSEFATPACKTRGRLHKVPLCNIRTEFQKDRDKIIHAKSFRRLKRKTQVFIFPTGDHFRTRLTHTLEVCQIARTLAKALRLNEDLTEAIALGHDLGHTPFGHAGETVLNQITPGGFRHFEHSLRMVDYIENDGQGLNLTFEVRDGILNHTIGKEPETLEGKLVRLSDKIAYVNHDVDDAIRAKLLKPEDLPEQAIEVLGEHANERLDKILNSIINNSFNQNHILMDEKIDKSFFVLHDFMHEQIYRCQSARKEEKKVPYIIEGLYKYFYKNIEKIPIEMQKTAIIEGKDRAVCDYIAGMSDYFAIKTFKDIFIPKSWNNY